MSYVRRVGMRSPMRIIRSAIAYAYEQNPGAAPGVITPEQWKAAHLHEIHRVVFEDSPRRRRRLI